MLFTFENMVIEIKYNIQTKKKDVEIFTIKLSVKESLVSHSIFRKGY